MVIFFFKQKTAYEMRISDWSSDVSSSDLRCSCRRSRRIFQPTSADPHTGCKRQPGRRTVPEVAGTPTPHPSRQSALSAYLLQGPSQSRQKSQLRAGSAPTTSNGVSRACPLPPSQSHLIESRSVVRCRALRLTPRAARPERAPPAQFHTLLLNQSLVILNFVNVLPPRSSGLWIDYFCPSDRPVAHHRNPPSH